MSNPLETNHSRRGFIKGLAALAALSCAPGLALAEAREEYAEFIAAAKTGEIVGRTFYIDGPIILTDMKNLIIYKCKFVCRNLRPPIPELGITGDSLLYLGQCENVVIDNCWFEIV